MRGTVRLTTLSKVLILLLIVGIIGGGIFYGVNKGLIVKEDKNSSVVVQNNTAPSSTNPDEDGNVINTVKASNDTINLSLDEWIGWKSMIDANGGLTTQPGSVYDQLGIKVNISIITRKMIIAFLTHSLFLLLFSFISKILS